MIVTPEYNRSIPGVLKNAIDIASRPYGKSSFNGKPLGLFGTSPGAHGGVSAVKHLQQIMPGIAGPIMQQPEIYAGMLSDAFDASGEVTKDSLKQFLTAYIQAFAAWVEKQKQARSNPRRPVVNVALTRPPHRPVMVSHTPTQIVPDRARALHASRPA